MNLKPRELVELDAFDPFTKRFWQVLRADHLDKRRIGINIGYHGQLGLPFASIAQPYACDSAFLEQNFLDSVHGANLPSVTDIGPLQHLSDGMRSAAREFRLF